MRFIRIAVTTLMLSANFGHAEGTIPIVSRVHTLSIHITSKKAYNSVFLFFRDELQLPVVYGELWNELKDGERIYCGFSAGNLLLEPCGPFPERFYTSLDFEARFYGLTFETSGSLLDGVAELDKRGITHAEPSVYTILTDKRLCRPNAIVSIMEAKDKTTDQRSLPVLRSSLRAKAGGPLGIEGVEEIVVGYKNDEDLKAWRTFLEPTEPVEKDLWRLKDGPAVHLIKSPSIEVKGIVLKVKSLEKAKRYLQERDLLGESTNSQAELNKHQTCGITLAVVE